MTKHTLLQIRGYKDSELERLEVEMEVTQIQSRMRTLERKSKSRWGSSSSSKEKQATASLLLLHDALDVKKQHIRALESLDSNSSSICCCFRCVGSLRLIFGMFLLLLTLTLATSLLLSASDPGFEDASGCGGSSGSGEVVVDVDITAGTAAGNSAAAAAGSSTSSTNPATTTGIDQVVKLVCEAETGYLGTLLNKPRLFNPFDETLVVRNYFNSLSFNIIFIFFHRTVPLTHEYFFSFSSFSISSNFLVQHF